MTIQERLKKAHKTNRLFYRRYKELRNEIFHYRGELSQIIEGQPIVDRRRAEVMALAGAIISNGSLFDTLTDHLVVQAAKCATTLHSAIEAELAKMKKS